MIKIKNKTTGILVALVIILTLVGGFFCYKYWQTTRNNPQRQTKELLEYVATIADVPSEAPTVATILDTTKLSNPTLRARSQNGDKLLIYTQSKRLILYRPSSKKIIETLTIEGSGKAGTGTDKAGN